MVLTLAVMTTLTGCAEPPAGPDGAAPQAPDAALDPADTVAGRLQSFAWDCERSGYVVQTFRDGPESMWLFLTSETTQLARVSSGSGARYQTDAIEFWSKGRDARLTQNGQTEQCMENRRASIREDAKLRGMDFLATGNEPAWTLEIGPEHILLISDFGARRELFSDIELSENQAAGTTRFTAAAGTRIIAVELRGAACADSMSGEQFTTSVEIRVDTQTYRGCGTALH